MTGSYRAWDKSILSSIQHVWRSGNATNGQLITCNGPSAILQGENMFPGSCLEQHQPVRRGGGMGGVGIKSWPMNLDTANNLSEAVMICSNSVDDGSTQLYRAASRRQCSDMVITR